MKSMVAAAVAVVAASGLAVAPALADPVNSAGKPVVPAAFDLVGVGSETDQDLINQLSVDYNRAHSRVHNATHPFIYSWNATPPNNPTQQNSTIKTKRGCATIARPNGGVAGVTALFDNVKVGAHFCIDFARASSFRSSTQPPFAPGGSAYVALARDAVSWATNATTNAPANLTTAQLKAIYTCTATRWNQVGGTSAATIDAILPPTTAGTRSFFLKVIGGGTALTPGPCVSPTTPEQNEGVAAIFRNNRNVVFPFSVGSYIAQKFHSPLCGRKPAPGQNQFGCDAIGNLVLRKINGTAPTRGTGRFTIINNLFTPKFLRILYDVVRFAASTPDHIPALEEPIFGRRGFFCSAAVRSIIAAYGFNNTVLCGIAS